MTLVKIDGISSVKHARAAAAFGADCLGMVFAPSRRQVTLGEAKRVVAALRKDTGTSGPHTSVEAIEAALHRRRPLLVGVFADQDADTVNAIADECGLDIVQLSGFEPWEMCGLLRRPVFKCVKVREGQRAEEIIAAIGEGGIVLLDAHVPGMYGGTGKTLDWGVAAAVARHTPTVLAGGLTPANVGQAVRTVRPWMVDVSSGVETDGVKDSEKMRAFIAAVKEASDD